MIIPAEYLKGVTREGYGQNLFKRLREQDENFSLNQALYQTAQILVADDNFGCGSSREHAVWALYDWGFRVVISSSFADIFTGNAGKNGLVLVELAEDIVRELLTKSSQAEYSVTVNLETQELTLADGRVEKFPYDEFRKHCIISGLDDVDYIQSEQAAIAKFREQQKATTFFDTTTS
jgi:3-isopropylmalate/(R)-2-methylmalate dehydratase small subunit